MTDAADLDRLSQALVSRRCGVVTELVPQPRTPDEPAPPHLWNATLAHFSFQNSPISSRIAGGKGRTETEAKLSALGEAIERYAAVGWDNSRIRVGVAAEGAVTPPECVLYSTDQYERGVGYAKWAPDTPTSWIEGTELPDRRPVEMPAALVYLLSRPPRAEDFVTSITSNGLAAGKDLTHAVLGGLHEMIERDAFMITWLNKLPAVRINPPQQGCLAAPIFRHYARFGVDISLYSLKTDQAAFVIMAVATEPTIGGTSRMVGLGCDGDPCVALDKAVFELCQLRPGMTLRKRAPDYAARLTRYDAVRSLDDHPLFHSLAEHAGEFDFLDASGAICDLADLPRPGERTTQEALDAIVQRAVASGARVVYADITPEDIAPLGPRVVRVIATGFQPIHFGHGEGRFGHHRLYNAPVEWGARDSPLTEAELNPCPHPLA